MKKLLFQYKLDKKNHFKSLLKNQLKTILIFLLIFTFCYFAINLEAFLYNFPYNTPLVLITYLIYLVVIFVIMFIISLIYSLIMTNIFKKSNAYRTYNYKLENDILSEDNCNFSVNLNEIKNIKIKKKYLKFISFKLKQVITFEKIYFTNKTDFDYLVKYFNEKNKSVVK